MHEATNLQLDITDRTSGIEALDIDSLDDVAGGALPVLLVAAGAGFVAGFTGTVTLIAARL